jgi:RNA polymerase sigma factor (sigma-70 family)
MTQFPSDEELMAGLVKGQTAMFEDLVRRYEPRLFGFICRLTANEADAADLFQETFLRVYTKAHDFQGKGSFRSWLYAIAANLCRSHATRHVRLVPTDPEDLPDLPNEGPLPDAALASEAIGRRIAAAIAILPAEQREVFVLKAYEELSYPEIADLLGRPVATVKSQMRYALEKMRALLHDLAQVHDLV